MEVNTNLDSKGQITSARTNSTGGAIIKNFVSQLNNSSATNSDLYGYAVDLNNTGHSGSVYGLYVDYTSLGTITGNRTYGVYVASPYFASYFAGKVGIGTQSAMGLLDIEKSSAGFWPLGADASDAIYHKAYYANVNSGVCYGYRIHRKARTTISTDGYSWDLESLSNSGSSSAPTYATLQSITPDGTLKQNGLIHSTSGGFKFPDGTTQTTASSGAGGGATYGTTTLNMGTIGTSTNSASVDVSAVSILSTSIVNCWLIIEETADHDFDDLINDPIELKCGKIVAALGLLFYGKMPVGTAWGNYKIGLLNSIGDINVTRIKIRRRHNTCNG